jgi:hypothetical protein
MMIQERTPQIPPEAKIANGEGLVDDGDKTDLNHS